MIACDGLWDVMEAKEVIQFVRSQLFEHGDLDKCVTNLVKEAEDRQSIDNISALIVFLEKRPK